MNKIDPSMKPEVDEHGHQTHYVTRTFPGLHLGEYVEVWVRYWKKGEKWDAKVYKMRFDDGHEVEWP